MLVGMANSLRKAKSLRGQFGRSLGKIENDSFTSQIQEICSVVALRSKFRNLPNRFVAGRDILYPANIRGENRVLAVIEWNGRTRVAQNCVDIGSYKPHIRPDSDN